MSKVILALTLIFAIQVYGQESGKRPDNSNELPITHLKQLRVDDVSRQLSEKERENLVRLFIQAYVTSVRKYKQDYLLETNTPVYQLLKANFSGVAEREGEGGIFLGAITRFFNRVPAYKTLVEQVLREDFNKRKKCQ